MRFAPVAALVLLSCSRSHAGSADAGPQSAGQSTAASATPGQAFGAYCVEDRECASAVCFHKRLKNGSQAPEQRGANDPVEHDGYCSISCNSDADCPVPPTSGRCGARGMCKRPE